MIVFILVLLQNYSLMVLTPSKIYITDEDKGRIPVPRLQQHVILRVQYQLIKQHNLQVGSF